MPQKPNDKSTPGLPGMRGTDYEIVNYGGKIYIIYKVKLPNGKTIQVSWAAGKDDYKHLGIDPGKVKHITKQQFKSIQFFGDYGEIARAGESGKHPLQVYMKQIREVYGGKVSWINDKEYMQVFLMGWMEGWDPGVLQQRLKRTKWYQERTAAERAWELDMNPADRKASIEAMTTQVTEALQDLYGPGIRLGEQGIGGAKITAWAKDIASGQYGNPGEGFNIWLEEQRNHAEKVEGSQAWIDRETLLEEQRGFMNRPEDMFQKLKEDSMYWLGPQGTPSDDTLNKWSNALVSEKKSDADWQQFLEKGAQRLYPWLDASTPWQEFADPYRRMAEETWGRPIAWDDPAMRNLGAADANGVPTGEAQTFQEWEIGLRKAPEFWDSPTGVEEGFGLFNKLNEVFSGVSA